MLSFAIFRMSRSSSAELGRTWEALSRTAVYSLRHFKVQALSELYGSRTASRVVTCWNEACRPGIA